MTGTNQGQLLTYDLPEGSVGQVPRIRTTKRDFLKSGSQAPITQLQAVPELNILLSVADAQVHVHDLETLSSMYVLEQSKGTVFAEGNHRRGPVSFRERCVLASHIHWIKFKRKIK